MPKLYFTRATIVSVEDGDPRCLDGRSVDAGEIRDVSKTEAANLIHCHKARVATPEDIKAAKPIDPPRSSAK